MSKPIFKENEENGIYVATLKWKLDNGKTVGEKIDLPIIQSKKEEGFAEFIERFVIRAVYEITTK